MSDEVERTGRVETRLVAPGSKSERQAVVLVADDGEHVLRRVGANPFTDPVLDDLIGRDVWMVGQDHAGTFLVSRWELRS